MKKQLFILAVLSISITFINAQTEPISSGVEFGANVGLNLATTSNTTDFDPTYKAGLDLGISADYYFSDRWSVKAKLIYDQKGWKDNGYSTSFKLNYLTFPVMANWHFGGSNRNWYLNFGPYAGFLINASGNGMDIKSNLKSTDFGLALGIGVKIPISDNLKIFIEDDGQTGFINIIKDNSVGSTINSRSALNIGINFTLQ